MKKTSNKIGLIGVGAVGASFIYSAINQGIVAEYILVDTFANAAVGNALDLGDTQVVLPTPFINIKAGDYLDLKDANLLVITAGKTRRPDQTRLEIVAENAMIMHEIGIKVRESGFDGITLIASNPVDVLTLIYQQTTGFSSHKVIGSSTNLDSARLRRLLGERLNVSPTSIDAYLLGEHGDSAVAIWSHASILGQGLDQYLVNQKIELDLNSLRDEAMKMGGKIISLKQATFYGIGATLTRIAKAVLKDEKIVLVVGAKLEGQYGIRGIYLGVPTIVGKNGWEKILEWKLDSQEQKLLQGSAEVLRESVKKACEAIDVNLSRM